MLSNAKYPTGYQIGDVLRISSVWALAWIMVASILFGSMSNPFVPLTERMPVLYLIVLCYVIVYVAWVTESRQPMVSRWFLVISVCMVTVLGVGWLNEPAFLVLLYVPVLLARLLISMVASTLAALLTTIGLLLVPTIFSVHYEALMLGFGIMSVWTAVVLMFAAYRPMYRVTGWAMENYQQARNLLEVTRDRKVELLEVQEELLRANRELSLSSERLRMFRTEADEARKAKETFVANVSHELRTPINMIIGLVDLLLETPEVYGAPLPDTLLQDLEIIQRNCNHLSKLVNDVLNLGRVEAGMLPLNYEMVNLQEDIEAVVTIVRPVVEKKGLYIDVKGTAGLPSVYCDRTRIRQVLLNLVSNAVRFTSSGGITIEVKREQTELVFIVTDTGSGILAEDKERIFEPFFQGSIHAQDSDGSGLGLSISRHFVEMHKGRIRVESQPGAGTTFLVHIPLVPPKADSFAAKRWLDETWEWQQRTSPIAIETAEPRTRVMLCDPTQSLQSLTTMLQDKIEFVEVSTVEDARRELTNVPAHLLLINTPYPESIGTLAASVQLQITDTPAMICSFQNPVKRAIEAGAVNYVTKPVQGEKLFEAIDTANESARRIMIVDDNEDLQQLLKRTLLARRSDLEIISICDSQDAIQEMCFHLPDVVLLDLMMPQMDGWEVLAQKAKTPSIRDIPTIIVSSQDLADQPFVSNQLTVTVNNGFSPKTLFASAVAISKILWKSV